ncbi:MAG: hypothetical protein E7373_05405 [Clostridiales bacterium]|nr:hypothetical protein [Clostridiales bacterium]
MKKTKIICLILSVLLSVTSLAACGTRGGGGQEIDETKSLLNIGVFEDGVGSFFVDKYIEDFVEHYKNTPFEDGKMGVQVLKEAKKDEFKAETLKTNMPYLSNVLWFVPGSPNDFLGDNLILDITDVMTEKIYDDNGDLAEVTGNPATKNILSSMHSKYDEFINFDGHYYSIPWRTYFYGTTYDADLFNNQRLYFLANGQIGANQANINQGNCSTGPDGVKGTSDDGMPNTWNDFVKLMDYMVGKKITPFTWSGQTDYQRRGFYSDVWANYEGANNFALNYSYNGTDSKLGEINSSNFTNLKNQKGRLAGLKASYDVTSKAAYHSDKADKNTYTEAQFEFAYSILTDKKVAMLFEGSFWEIEAKMTFDDMAKTNPDFGYGKRDFRWLPIPNFVGVDGVPDQTKSVNENGAYDRVLKGTAAHKTSICIAARADVENYETQVKLAKLFIKFIHSREQLANFTKNTGGCWRPFNFTVTDEEIAEWPGVARSIYKYLEEGATIVDNLPLSNYIRDNQELYAEGRWEFRAPGGYKGVYYDPIQLFMEQNKNAVNVTVQQCYNSMLTQFSHDWE